MELIDAIRMLKSHYKTDRAAAKYVGYKPEYYYALLKLEDEMPEKAKERIFMAAELLILRQQARDKPRLTEATA